jgi:hypothetical protein
MYVPMLSCNIPQAQPSEEHLKVVLYSGLAEFIPQTLFELQQHFVGCDEQGE